MRKYLFILIIKLIIVSLFANENIVNFRIEKTGPIEKRLYLVDENDNEDYGYYSFIKEVSYGSSIDFSITMNKYSVIDNTIEPYKNKIKSVDIMNMGMSQEYYFTNLIWSISSGSLGIVGLSIGIPFLAYVGYLYSGYVKNFEPTFLHSNPDNMADFASQNDLSGFFMGGVFSLIFGGLGIISLGVFLGIALYNYDKYVKMKARIIRALNKIEVKDKNDVSKLIIKFDIIIS